MTGDLEPRLTDEERAQLKADEAIIDAGLAEFLKVGMALCRIRDSRLYRETHGTFEAYVEKRWHIGRTRAYQFIEAGHVTTAMSTIVDTPPIENEAQARALAPILKEHGPEVAADTLRAAAAASPVTARSITEHAPTPLVADGDPLPATSDEIPDDEPGDVLAQLASTQAVEEFISSDSEIRAANLRADFSRWIVAIGRAHLFDPEEMADVSPDRVDDVQRVSEALRRWVDQFRRHARSSNLRIVKESQ